MKKHNIETIQDIVDCTNEENLERFLVDLRILLTTAHNIRDLNRLTRNVNSSGLVRFTWIDDGAHNAKITITDRGK